LQPEAVKRVQRSLILEAIATKEGLEVSDVEVDAEIRKAATAGQKEFAEVKARLREDGSYEELRLALLQDKALDFVVEQSKTIA
jgi:trigger factor